MITRDKLMELISYDRDTGVFIWAKNRKGVIAGTKAGRITNSGYCIIRLLYKQYPAHRLAWFYIHGKWPTHEIDHINGIRDDNKISNLRCATHQQNRCNSLLYSNNKTGLKGVYYYKQKRKWVAQITRNGINNYLGIFSSPEEAHMAYCNASKAHDPVFFNNDSKTRSALKAEGDKRRKAALEASKDKDLSGVM